MDSYCIASLSYVCVRVQKWEPRTGVMYMQMECDRGLCNNVVIGASGGSTGMRARAMASGARDDDAARGASGASMRVRCGFCFIAFDGSTVRAIGMRLGWMIDADCRCEK